MFFWRSFFRIVELIWLVLVREIVMMSVFGWMIFLIFRLRRVEMILSLVVRIVFFK